ncbi:MAG: phytanoyl-CoA dioxygenase family protein [Acidimicrobiales bacterium]
MGELLRLSAQEASVDAIVDALEQDGCVVVERFIPPAKVTALKAELAPHRDETPLGRNDFEGFATKRIYALFAKTRGFDELATHPTLLGVLDRVLGHYQLSGPVGIDVGPHESPQGLHRDDVVYPLSWPHPQVVLNTMWALDDFTADNGATLIVPGSHRSSPDEMPPDDAAIKATMPAGSVMFYVGTVWHGGGANETDERRLGVILEYAASWLRAQENHVTAVPVEVMRTLDPRLQELLGYNIFPPFLGYVDGRHPLRAIGGRAARA